MTQCLEFYRCEICGNIVQVLHQGVGELVCCGASMKLLSPATNDPEIGEKHVPVFKDDNKVVVGELLHPMTEEHHIEFIEAVSEDKKHVEINFLDLNDEPTMYLCNNQNHHCAYEYCNLHGLWKGEK